MLNVDTKWRTHPDVTAVPREEWHGHPSVAELYCLAICHRRDIRTLRDLRVEHVPMLKEMYRWDICLVLLLLILPWVRNPLLPW